jgi:hypothetical protein
MCWIFLGYGLFLLTTRVGGAEIKRGFGTGNEYISFSKMEVFMPNVSAVSDEDSISRPLTPNRIIVCQGTVRSRKRITSFEIEMTMDQGLNGFVIPSHKTQLFRQIFNPSSRE